MRLGFLCSKQGHLFHKAFLGSIRMARGCCCRMGCADDDCEVYVSEENVCAASGDDERVVNGDDERVVNGDGEREVSAHDGCVVCVSEESGGDGYGVSAYGGYEESGGDGYVRSDNAYEVYGNGSANAVCDCEESECEESECEGYVHVV